MAQAIRQAKEGFYFGKDQAKYEVHQSLADLFSLETNEHSLFLKRYESLVQHVAGVACSASTPASERVHHFTFRLSAKSVRSRIRDYCGNGKYFVLFDQARRRCPEHLPHLPSILSSHMSYPLIAMSRSVKSHRIQNNLFRIAMLRKLRLPVFEPANCPRCWCGKMHDCWGDHAFTCVANNKTMAHNYIRDALALALQAPLATACFLLATAKLEKETAGLIESNGNCKPLDVSFGPEPAANSTQLVDCPYNDVGADVTITPPVKGPADLSSENVIESVTAAAESNIQKKEKLMLQRPGLKDEVADEVLLGDNIMGELIQKNAVMIPFAIDPHGQWGPMADTFLFGKGPRKH
ncbi:hypothetical protein ACHAWF_013396 [Thalassiosira exigua]